MTEHFLPFQTETGAIEVNIEGNKRKAVEVAFYVSSEVEAEVARMSFVLPPEAARALIDQLSKALADSEGKPPSNAVRH